MLPPVQEMQDLVAGYPPHTTNLPPGRRETLISFLASGKPGIEQVSSGGEGKSSTEKKRLLSSQPFYPPTTTCPNAKLIKILPKRKHTTLQSKDEESIMKTRFPVLTFAFAWNSKERQKDEDTGPHDY